MLRTSIVVFVAALLHVPPVAAEIPTPEFNCKIPEHVLTPNLVKTSIGTLQFYDGLLLLSSNEGFIKKLKEI